MLVHKDAVLCGRDTNFPSISIPSLKDSRQLCNRLDVGFSLEDTGREFYPLFTGNFRLHCVSVSL